MIDLDLVSVICPIYNEEKYIKSCIDSILSQDFDKDKLELLLVDGLSTDGTRQIIKDYECQYGFIKLLDNPDKTVPYALNLAINNAHGNIILRIDAHCGYPKNYISTLVGYLCKLDCDNVGAVLNTMPAKQTVCCIAIAEAISNPFGVGNSLFRVGVDDITLVDTVPFGCYKREVFSNIGLFDTDLVRNQDDEFNARLIKNGGKIYLIPNLVIDYIARDSMIKLFKMYYQYGLYKPLVNKKVGSPATLRQFIPSLFVLGICIGGGISIVIPYFWVIYIFVLLIYIFTGLIIGINKSIKHKHFGLIFLMPYTFFVLHVSYGIGYIQGIYKVLLNKNFNVKSNR